MKENLMIPQLVAIRWPYSYQLGIRLLPKNSGVMLTEYDLQQILSAGFILNNFKIIENA
nr:hypothetical protein [Nostoc sp. ChiQUE02]